MAHHPYRVAVFARNEASNIAQTLDSIRAAVTDGRALEIRVLINGCTDDTAQVVQAYADQHEGIVGIELPVGDKCNAWNAYLHQHAQPWLSDEDIHFFMDGDVGASLQALPKMRRLLMDHPQAYAVAGAPMNGRHRKSLTQLMIDRRWIYGGLYAVRGSQLARMREANIRLPLGLCGNDHMISRLLKTNFPKVNDIDEMRILPQSESGYTFRPLMPWRLEDWQLYRKRRVTYALRHEQLLRIGEQRLDQLPATMDTVNQAIFADLKTRKLKRWSAVAQVRKRLARLYPNFETAHYTRMLQRAA